MGIKQTNSIILTGPHDQLAYWKPQRDGRRAFRFDGMFTRETRLSFARVSPFAANGNHAPKGRDGANTSDCALIFLHHIAMGG
tara:strand:- start:18931 stop:19179 length:249 start_codon:yes stop_codon:yes gene_type:complete